MSLIPSVLYAGGQLTTSAAALVTAGVNAKTVITSGSFDNTDSVTRVLTVYIVRSGGTASAANRLFSRSVGAGTTDSAPELAGQILGPGDMVQAKADAGAVVTCAGVSGYVIS